MEQTFVLLSVLTISVWPLQAISVTLILHVSKYRDGLSVFGLQRPKKACFHACWMREDYNEIRPFKLLIMFGKKKVGLMQLSTRAFIC
jgi:hypothetical protein